MSRIADVVKTLPAIFKPEKAKGWNRTILFDLTGEEPSKWTITVENGTCTVEEGQTKEPRLTISGESQYICQMFSGETPPMKLVNAKLLKMKGPMMDSIAFSGLWNIPKKA